MDFWIPETLFLAPEYSDNTSSENLGAPPPPPPPLLEDDEAGRGPDPCIFRAESTSNRQQELISKQEIHLLVAIEDSQAAAWNSRKGAGAIQSPRARP